MQLISTHDGKLLRLNETHVRGSAGRVHHRASPPRRPAAGPKVRPRRGSRTPDRAGKWIGKLFRHGHRREQHGRGRWSLQNPECRVRNERQPRLLNFQFLIFNFQLALLFPLQLVSYGPLQRTQNCESPPSASAEVGPTVRQTRSLVGQTFLSAVELARGEVLFSRANSSLLGGLKPALAASRQTRMSAPPKKPALAASRQTRMSAPPKKPTLADSRQTRMSAPQMFPALADSIADRNVCYTKESRTRSLDDRNFKFQIPNSKRQKDDIASSSQFEISNLKFEICNSSSLIWSDPFHQLYPPALAAHGIPLNRLLLLRPRDLEEQTWAVAECLRCRGVGAVVAAPADLSRTEARRLQLAAEQGGGVGLLLRTTRAATHYAAATRWLVRPAPGERTLQRWNIQLLHGHGGRIGQTVCLEYCRETHRLRVSDPMARRQDQSRVARAS